MAQITAAMVKQLRDKSGAGMMDCKKALVENDGDFDKAMTILRERGAAIAGKRSGRATKEGLAQIWISDDCHVGAIADLNCETDFVARNDDFKNLAAKLAAFAGTQECCCDFSSKVVEDGKTVNDLVQEIMGKIGENMSCPRAAVLRSPDGYIASYSHTNNKISALVELAPVSAELAAKDEFKAFARDLAVQAVACGPLCLSPAEMPAKRIEEEKEVYRAQALNEGTKEAFVDRVVEGRLKKFYAESCLLDQVFLKDPNGKQSVRDFIAEKAKAFGVADLAVKQFVRIEVGAELDNEEEDK
ncbi:translation elongation factor Ts [Candidatus Sumerlaeota bacterium]|nr:translation elongation factor Ts [Candidatus Sumerlaeales bacterium]NLD61788.1 translation elongation factor Ts [Candidatus Sumerlaeota bacterium]